jgi:hypothetical protein
VVGRSNCSVKPRKQAFREGDVAFRPEGQRQGPLHDRLGVVVLKVLFSQRLSIEGRKSPSWTQGTQQSHHLDRP